MSNALLSSANTLSFESVFNSPFNSVICFIVFSSTSKFNCVANLATLYTLNGSSLKCSVVALIILFFKSSFPLNGSIIFPVNTSFAIAFIVMSLRAKSSSIVICESAFISNSLCPFPSLDSVLANANSFPSISNTEKALPRI